MSSSAAESTTVSPMAGVSEDAGTAAGPAIMTPTPMEVMHPPPPTVVRELEVLKTDANNKLVVKYRPWDLCIPLMGPCCCFHGCYHPESLSSDIIFDDDQKTVSVTTWPGYCCMAPFLKSRQVNYSDIGNVGFAPTDQATGFVSETGVLVQQYSYYLALFMSNGDFVRLGCNKEQENVAPEVFKIHRFFYDRGGAEYVTPTVESLTPVKTLCKYHI